MNEQRIVMGWGGGKNGTLYLILIHWEGDVLALMRRSVNRYEDGVGWVIEPYHDR